MRKLVNPSDMIASLLVPPVMATIVWDLLLIAGLVSIALTGARTWKKSRELRQLRVVRSQAQVSHDRVLGGLRQMAGIVPRLRVSQLGFSRRGVDLLDTQSALLLALRRAKTVVAGASGSRRETARQLAAIAGLKGTFERFQQAVLTAVYQQSALRVVMPPVSASKYRAAFTVLSHDLPGALWPVMNAILRQHVEMWVGDATGAWRKVRGLGFRLGKEVVFSRKCLENAVEIRLTLNGRTMNEYSVAHERPLKAANGSFREWLCGSFARPVRCNRS